MTNQPEQKTARSFVWFICIAYVTQGIAQQFGLVSQPLDYYMLKELGKNAADVAALLSLLMIPWMIKPLYGLVSDFCPLFGYRRKTYLAMAYGVAGVCFVLAALLDSFSLLVAALFVTAVGMSMGTAIVCGLTLEVGRPTSRTRSFQSIQAVCYYSANLASFLVGGLLCTHLAPKAALHSAALIAAAPCLLAAVSSLVLVDEQKAEPERFSASKLKELIKQFRMRGLLLVALFLCCWSFSPGFGTPLYFYETKTLAFSQLFIGQLGAINAFGMICGALFYKKYMDGHLSPRTQAVISVVMGTVSTVAYLWLGSEFSAIILEFFRGGSTIIATLTIYGLAADVSPKKLESTTIAFLIAAYNIAEQVSNVVGANLYTYTFGEAFAPLIVVSALATLACLVLVPFLPQKDQHQ